MLKRMDHVGIVVHDLPAAVAFFTALGLASVGEATVEGQWVDRIVALEGVRADIAMLQTPDGHAHLELTRYHSPVSDDDTPPAPANARGIRHVTFAVDDVDAVLATLRTHGAELVGEVVRYENSYRLCYVRGPQGIIVELTQELG